MIVMTPDATQEEIARVKQRLEPIEGLHVLVPSGQLITAIGAIGEPEGVSELGLERMAGIDRVAAVSRSYERASSESRTAKRRSPNEARASSSDECELIHRNLSRRAPAPQT